MAITLPNRVPNGSSFTPAQYQQINAPAAAFGNSGQGLIEGGKDLMAMAQTVADHAQRVQTREDVVARAGAQSAYAEAAQREMTRLSTEADWADLKTFDGYGAYLTDSLEQTIAKAGGSADSQAMLRARLTDMRGSLINQAAQVSAAAGLKRVTGLMDQSLSGLTAKVLKDPAKLADLAMDWDRTVDDFAPALTQDHEAAYRLEGRRALISATLNQLIDRPTGAAEASRMINANPHFMEMLSPDQQQGLYRKMNAAAEAERQARAAADAELNKLRSLLNREPTMSERYQRAGLGGTMTGKLAQIQELEATGIKLSPAQQLDFLGIKPTQGLTAQTDAGKAIADRQMFVEQFGARSPQVKAFDDMAAKGAGPGDTEVSGMRKEHTALSKDFVTVQAAYTTLQSLRDNPSATSDVGLIISVMKVMDPGSVVQQGEQETASKTAGIPDYVWSWYQKAQTGERLTPEQRADFVRTAKHYYDTRLADQQRIDLQFRGMATRAGYNPDDVVMNFIKAPAGAAPPPHPPATGVPAPTTAPPSLAAGTEAPAAQPTPPIRLDINGNIAE